MRTRVKICGITRREDLELAISAGADAIGLVFYHPSPRAVTIAKAQALLVDLPPFITVVGLFVNEQRARIAEVIASVRIDLLQFHGDEHAKDCSGYGRPWIKAIPMHEGVNIAAMRTHYQEAVTLLLDAYKPGIPGGTGGSFDWRLIGPHWRDKIILAGGLTPDTVEQAVRQVRPYAVDVSSGVESTSGIKDADKVMAFMRGVRAAEFEDYH